MRERILLSAFILIGIFLTEPVFAADWKLTASATYETGKYGTPEETETLYLPVTLKRYFDIGDVSVTVPYISQKSSGRVAVVDGTVFRTGNKAVASTTESGIGDVILKGSLYLMQKEAADISIIGKIKLPTADKNKGLGTGEFDETVGLEFDRVIMPQCSVYIDAYYTFTGSPPGADLKNRSSFDVGLSYKISKDLTDSLFYEESTPLVSGEPNFRVVGVNVEYKLGEGVSIFGGAAVGLTDSSPDHSLTAGFNISF